MNYTANIGLIAGFLTSIAFIPQTFKVMRDKQTEGISLPMYFIFTSGVVCWIMYSIFVKDLAVFLTNVFTFIFAFPVLLFLLKSKAILYKNRKQ